jgi:DNA-binding NarL/FixJ family response regulator
MTCLILTTYEDSETIFNALKAGAAGYLLKRASAKEIVAAIAEVANGGSPMSPQIARRVVDYFHQPRAKNALDTLSEREHEVLQRLAAGLMYKEIADQLKINIGTVRFHINRIYGKLHVHSRAEAMLKYLGRA